MKAKPLRKVADNTWEICQPEDASHVEINMPGPSGRLMLPIMLKGTRKNTNQWTWNGDTEKPTLRPSLLSKPGDGNSIICHSWVNDGQAQFLNDSTHELAGQTIDLLDV